MTYTVVLSVHLFVYHADQSADMPNKWTWYVRIRPLLQKKKKMLVVLTTTWIINTPHHPIFIEN